MRHTTAVLTAPGQLDWAMPPVEDPEALKARIRELHANAGEDLDDMRMDGLLYSAPNTDTDLQIARTMEGAAVLRGRYDGEEIWFPGTSGYWTPYNAIRAVDSPSTY